MSGVQCDVVAHGAICEVAAVPQYYVDVGDMWLGIALSLCCAGDVLSSAQGLSWEPHKWRVLCGLHILHSEAL